ncbi:MAG: hypothetical protein IPN87_19790 [Saprospiraceae bacterium]|nr:hypothetical protein [Candidatus Brachybacter algidus]
MKEFGEAELPSSPSFPISLGHFEPQSGEKTYFIQIGQSVTSLQPTEGAISLNEYARSLHEQSEKD